ncbi:alpha/beta hydrolase [Streptomyces aidingensis]|uniref:Alpha/beta hydrolase n=1 Tax=Streptomyces aidingensis TaxID=910347 RepID=A0A1I1L1T9_9ACTN|nr:alpha/beta hydrolase [Streptomyces aidingensis]SFC67004.1 Alpha/beta hydrolase [Streptomyces aidingensis]
MPRSRRAVAAATLFAVLGTGSWSAFGTPLITGQPPGTAAWLADGAGPPDPAGAAPAEVAAYFAALGPAAAGRLAERHPRVAGNLDGAPPELRYAANARAWMAHFGEPPEPGRQLLAFDPRGRGTFAEVYGDLAAAERIAVIVPGTGNDLERHATPDAMARGLLRRMAQDDPSAAPAVIAWVGYTTPGEIGADAAAGRLAEAGAPRLARFLAGLAAVTDAAPPAVFCHSYGAVVCGLAAARLAPEDAGDLVFFAAPGTRASSAEALGTTARVWAARAPEDWVGRVPDMQVLGLGHGPDPTGPAYGARVVTARTVDGHAGYLEPGTDALRNFSAIALGDHTAVTCSPGSQECHDARRR